MQGRFVSTKELYSAMSLMSGKVAVLEQNLMSITWILLTARGSAFSLLEEFAMFGLRYTDCSFRIGQAVIGQSLLLCRLIPCLGRFVLGQDWD